VHSQLHRSTARKHISRAHHARDYVRVYVCTLSLSLSLSLSLRLFLSVARKNAHQRDANFLSAAAPCARTPLVGTTSFANFSNSNSREIMALYPRSRQRTLPRSRAGNNNRARPARRRAKVTARVSQREALFSFFFLSSLFAGITRGRRGSVD